MHTSLLQKLPDGRDEPSQCTVLRKATSVRKALFLVCSVSLPLFLWHHFLFSPAVKDEDLPFFSSAGFVDLQTENADLLETAGAIPFLDYKHFAAKIFFPEVQLKPARQHVYKSVEHVFGDMTVAPFSWQSKSLMASCIKDIGQVRLWLQLSQTLAPWEAVSGIHCGVVSDLNQDVVQVQLDAGCQGMSKLIHDQLFLTSMVHALEEQKNFSIKEKSVWWRFFTEWSASIDCLSYICLLLRWSFKGPVLYWSLFITPGSSGASLIIETLYKSLENTQQI